MMPYRIPPEALGARNYPRYVFGAKKECEDCREVKKAVKRYNRNQAPKDVIPTVYTHSLRYRRYKHFLRTLFAAVRVRQRNDPVNEENIKQELHGNVTVPTPFIWMDGHVILWERGGPDKIETLSQLNTLGGDNPYDKSPNPVR